MITSVRNFKKALINVRGWSTSRRIVVLVSDDWGSIRTPSEAALDGLRKHGIKVDKCHYMLNDRLESGDDLERLFNLLQSFTDARGRSPILTANFLTANPDFERIRRSNFSDYFSESIVQTYEASAGADRNMSIWQEATGKKICLPQSHGREHLNVTRWMSDLQHNDSAARTAFDYGVFGLSAHTTVPRRESYLAAFDGAENEDGGGHHQIVSDALLTFREIFGFESRSFIAPNYVWGPAVERAAGEHGVDYIQSGTMQWLPAQALKVRRRHYQGERNIAGQRYVVRNVHFEPASDASTDWVGQALKEIDLAFKLRKPAVVSTHRVNFMGGLRVANRDRGLFLFESLLAEVIKRWSGIEFLSAVELGDTMSGGGSER